MLSPLKEQKMLPWISIYLFHWHFKLLGNFGIYFFLCISFRFSLSHPEKLVLFLVYILKSDSSATSCSALEYLALRNTGLDPNKPLMHPRRIHLRNPHHFWKQPIPQVSFLPLSLHGFWLLSSLRSLVPWLILLHQIFKPALDFSISASYQSLHPLAAPSFLVSSFYCPCPTDSDSWISPAGCLLHSYIWPRALLGLDRKGHLTNVASHQTVLGSAQEFFPPEVPPVPPSSSSWFLNKTFCWTSQRKQRLSSVNFLTFPANTCKFAFI